MAHVRWSDSATPSLRDAAAVDLRADETLLVSDLDGRLVGADEAGALGLGPDALLGRTTRDLSWRLVRIDGSALPEDENPAVVAMRTGAPVLDLVLGIETSYDGLAALTWCSVSALPLRGPDGLVEGVATALRDVSATPEGRRATAVLADSLRAASHSADLDQARFRLLAESAADVVLQTDIAGHVVWVSPSVTEVLGWAPDALVGSSSLPLLHPDDRERANEVRRHALSAGADTAVARLEVRYATSDGGWRWMSVLARPMRDSQGQVVGGLSALRDVQAEVENREELRYLAGHDGLTGLLNRESSLRALGKAIDAVRGTGRCVGVLYLDVDRFKDVNDSLGHHAGDRLLIELSRRLVGVLRETDVVGRLGGDEFLVVLSALKEPGQADTRAESLLRTLSAPTSDAPTSTVSIGVVTDDGTSAAADVLQAADDALYRAKNGGRDRISR
ncbi:MAG TPA: diguanylate cyclase [Candidatus Nanopelagicales bacterium]|nr:diguanylate cyclase [Candidatus Nanopelagicales bacterium]